MLWHKWLVAAQTFKSPSEVVACPVILREDPLSSQALKARGILSEDLLKALAALLFACSDHEGALGSAQVPAARGLVIWRVTETL